MDIFRYVAILEVALLVGHNHIYCSFKGRNGSFLQGLEPFGSVLSGNAVIPQCFHAPARFDSIRRVGTDVFHRIKTGFNPGTRLWKDCLDIVGVGVSCLPMTAWVLIDYWWRIGDDNSRLSL